MKAPAVWLSVWFSVFIPTHSSPLHVLSSVPLVLSHSVSFSFSLCSLLSFKWAGQSRRSKGCEPAVQGERDSSVQGEEPEGSALRPRRRHSRPGTRLHHPQSEAQSGGAGAPAAGLSPTELHPPPALHLASLLKSLRKYYAFVTYFKRSMSI